VIWGERNVLTFRQKEESLQQLLDKIKPQSYWWLKAKRSALILLLTIICGGLTL
jgi:hypothetical protein